VITKASSTESVRVKFERAEIHVYLIGRLDPGHVKRLRDRSFGEVRSYRNGTRGVAFSVRGEGVPVGDRIRTAVLRLLSEGRKAAFRVLMLAQRFEATAVGGGYARGQFALRLSFRVPADSLEMLHGTDARPLGPEHANAAPGVAYLSGLGRDCERLRVPYFGEYGEYVDRIQTHGRRAAS
jgi:hypothetical protein